MRHKVSCRDLQVSNNVTALGFMPNLARYSLYESLGKVSDIKSHNAAICQSNSLRHEVASLILRVDHAQPLRKPGESE